ncbi:hypothetical protein TcWFU_002976 [Taenia crassiceps]|uniref:Uncharacterized protein n=1 Tax=Taenia crassiceps TaxID=6207 RepID=A0ABR4Q1M6_9CEST
MWHQIHLTPMHSHGLYQLPLLSFFPSFLPSFPPSHLHAWPTPHALPSPLTSHITTGSAQPRLLLSHSMPTYFLPLTDHCRRRQKLVSIPQWDPPPSVTYQPYQPAPYTHTMWLLLLPHTSPRYHLHTLATENAPHLWS